jgi:hypothetical protein
MPRSILPAAAESETGGAPWHRDLAALGGETRGETLAGGRREGTGRLRLDQRRERRGTRGRQLRTDRPYECRSGPWTARGFAGMVPASPGPDRAGHRPWQG